MVTRPFYALWCLGEIVVAAMFMSLYVVLMSKGQLQYFETAGLMMVKMLLTCVYPYGFLWLGLELYAKSNEEPVHADENSLIRFYDEYKKLRLVIGTPYGTARATCGRIPKWYARR